MLVRRSLLLQAGSLIGVHFPIRGPVPEAGPHVVVGGVTMKLRASDVVKLVQLLERLQEVVRLQRVAPPAQAVVVVALEEHITPTGIADEFMAAVRAEPLVALIPAVLERRYAASNVRQWPSAGKGKDL